MPAPNNLVRQPGDAGTSHLFSLQRSHVERLGMSSAVVVDASSAPSTCSPTVFLAVRLWLLPRLPRLRVVFLFCFFGVFSWSQGHRGHELVAVLGFLKCSSIQRRNKLKINWNHWVNENFDLKVHICITFVEMNIAVFGYDVHVHCH